MFNSSTIDISENELLSYDDSLLSVLLFDRTTQRNIIWGTSDYEDYGDEYSAQYPIEIHLITGKNKNIIQPRVYKEKANQTSRTKNKAEVFTPSWICNAQNNLIDNSWFKRKNVFNIEGYKTWTATIEPIFFEEKRGKRWTDYVDARRMEITCGEAPYLVSRYDAVSGEPIPLQSRIGLLDRKLRVVNENTTTDEEWEKWTIRAFQSIYGFDFQGDSLLLARENLLYTYIEHYRCRYAKEPSLKELKAIATIISWNIWQMDGLTFTIPYSVVTKQYEQMSFVEDLEEIESEPCYCKIKDWRAKETVLFASLVKKGEQANHDKKGKH